ncbi:hypothetical protein TBLA_0E04580 [Henningerozyma blattae CBS 6284]|uniref:Uncharacterized protein n=1 Tax=Henningerozyma blattae (strain ATCC 34711 / CBS 6284 / DSM 70876 / NBRC 10599 / NRRL Y-10934 / UCD 77-7) TaxID=1071380 RepID=I2H558_HENB6|nr:hypothetical protein TBLA_0E04580 [Tetrapisispora blattae CBS 6284]CCH61510.1 hypothetical protein TBLA_0E04580 [Tetrapisispora blattae CBS 6284]
MKWTDAINFCRFHNQVISFSDNILGSFLLDDTLVERIIKPYTTGFSILEHKELGTMMEFQIRGSTYIQIAKQLYSTYFEKDRLKCKDFADELFFDLPITRRIAELLSGIGNINTKLGIIGVRYPFTTIRTALANATFISTSIKRLNNEYYSFIDCPMTFPYQDLVWNDEEGYIKTQDFCKDYLKEKFKTYRTGDAMFTPPDTNKLVPFKLINKELPQWFPNRNEYLKVYKLFMLSEDQFKTEFETNFNVLKNSLKLVGLHPAVITTLQMKQVIRHLYSNYFNHFSRWFTNNYEMVSSPGTGVGCIGQLYTLKYDNGFKAQTQFITSDADRKYGYALTPAKQVDIDLYYEIRSNVKPEMVVSNYIFD